MIPETKAPRLNTFPLARSDSRLVCQRVYNCVRNFPNLRPPWRQTAMLVDVSSPLDTCCQEPATGDQRAWPLTPRALSFRENRRLTKLLFYSIGQLGRCIGLQIHREGYQARQDESQEDRQSVNQEESRRYGLLPDSSLAICQIFMLIGSF